MAQGRRRFEYQPPSYEETVARAERKGGRDVMFKDVKMFQPRQGANLVRILPPTWEGNRGHYGLYIKLHYNVGPDDRRYLCLRDKHSPYNRCPVDEALSELGPNASREEYFALRAADGVAYYLIDRENEGEGVQVWLSSSNNDSEIASQSTNLRNKSVLPIADPYDGYDVEFFRIGSGRRGAGRTKYQGFKVVRESSPLSDNDRRLDEWLDYIAEHPLPTRLNFYKPEYVEEVFYGRSKSQDAGSTGTRRARDVDADDDADDRRPASDDDPGERPSRSIRRTRENDSPANAEPDDRDSEAENRSSTRSPRYSRTDDPASDDRPSRRPRTDDDGDEGARLASKHTRTNGEDRPAEPDGTIASRTVLSRRTRLNDDLDDEIPSEAARRGTTNGRDANGHDDDDEKRDTRVTQRDRRDTRTSTRDDAETRSDARPTRSRGVRDDDAHGDDDVRPERGHPTDDGDEVRRSAMRERLRR